MATSPAGDDIILPPQLPRKALHSPGVVPYTQGTLIIGDGNFSFSAALCTHLGGGAGVTATTYDREDRFRDKYPVNCAAQCQQLGARVHFEVDATQMMRDDRIVKSKYRFIVFNFPHTDHQQTSDDPEEVGISIQANRTLLSAFFVQAKRLLAPDGEIHISVKDRLIYRRWELHKLAEECGLCLVQVMPFDEDLFPGYSHVATRADVKKVDLEEAYTMCWVPTDHGTACPIARLYSVCHTQEWMLDEFLPLILDRLGGWSEADFGNFAAEYCTQKQGKSLDKATYEFASKVIPPLHPSCPCHYL